MIPEDLSDVEAARWVRAGVYAGWALATSGKWGQPTLEDIEEYVEEVLDDLSAWEDE